ncbi:bifunctional folylpolyglutamate synthase/dihydrofolate synthase [Fictibacillus gelatini]|uniref:bifunctional folylpolyglutamate synthase/dihydrofolate synthase n=1 Tax=Fictibacillus gelatini TaxID=225985 RepID=UPI0003F90A5F|nr:folylpolyglutamate synthase/dihydrofolate synthase family protein [Fictibacillus gelatini]
MNTFEEALNWVHGLLTFGIKPGLKRMEWMLERLNHPERHIKTIHVAGTNGKGSTVTYLRHMLEEAGYTVGTFTSPYVITFNERISVNGQPISNEDFLQLANQVRPLAEELAETELGSPTEFEVITAISLLYFANIAYPDVVIYEVGLGGLHDSTNVIHPILSIITNVGYDHMNILGNTIEEIAGQKAGIIKFGIPVITGAEEPAALQVIKEKAKRQHANCFVLNEQFSYENRTVENGEEVFSYESLLVRRENLHLSMKGEHQVKNAALALMAIDYLNFYYAFCVEQEAVQEGLKKAKWQGRFELVSSDPTVILDGAHNPEGIRSLRDTLQSHYPEKKIHLLFTALADKEIDEMLAEIYGLVQTITFTTFSFHRSSSAKDLYDRSQFPNKFYDENWRHALQKLMESAGRDDIIVVTGSLYFISDVRGYFTNS